MISVIRMPPVILGLVVAAGRLGAQTAPPASSPWILEGVAGGYLTDHPEGGPIGLGFAIGTERRLALRNSVRLSVSWRKTVVTADDISLCHPLPEGGCLPDSVFPGSLWSVDMLFVRQPVASMPLTVVAGVGALLRGGELAGHGADEDPDAEARSSATWRVGAEILLGRSTGAPRIQVTRLGLIRDMLSLTGMFDVALQLRLRVP
jgi:hypothetical protein